MRYLTASETLIHGGEKVHVKLPRPEGDFQDVRVLAFPAPEDYGSSITGLHPEIQVMPALAGASRLIDNHTGTVVSLPSGTQTVITLNVPESFTARSLTVSPAKTNITFTLLLDWGDTGDRKSVV